MDQYIFSRMIMALIFSCGVTYWVDSRCNREAGLTQPDTRPRYSSEMTGSVLILVLPVIIIVESIFCDFEISLGNALAFYFTTFLHIGIYYIILMPFIPVLRRKIGARTVAMLWIIPNYLYVMYLYDSAKLARPRFIINLSSGMFSKLIFVWVSGFLAVFIYNILNHISFRRFVLKDARPVDDVRTMNILSAVVREANIKKPKFKLVYSHNVTTPLSVGLFSRAVRIVLPYKDYTDSELYLILKHEIIHISREDSWAKFYMMMCTAICWFNPFMWFAMKRCAEDIELGCDEAVLANTDADTRNEYARLILNTAGNDRGFTTCLSSSAKALLYRLTNITKPVKRTTGAYLLGIVFFLLSMTSGYTALAYDEKTGADYIYNNIPYREYTLNNMYIRQGGNTLKSDVENREDFHKFISGLKLSKTGGGQYAYNTDDYIATFELIKDRKTVTVYLFEDGVKTRYRENKRYYERFYYSPEGIEAEQVKSFFMLYPSVNVKAYDQNNTMVSSFNAKLTKFTKTVNGETTTLPVDNYGYGTPGVYGFDEIERFELIFSKSLAKPVTVVAQNNETGETVTYRQNVITDSYTFPREKQVTVYTVYADFSIEERIYSGQFTFKRGAVE